MDGLLRRPQRPNSVQKINPVDLSMDYRELVLNTSRMLDTRQLSELIYMSGINATDKEQIAGDALTFLILLEQQGNLGPDNFWFLQDILKRCRMGKILSDFNKLTDEYEEKVRAVRGAYEDVIAAAAYSTTMNECIYENSPEGTAGYQLAPCLGDENAYDEPAMDDNYEPVGESDATQVAEPRADYPTNQYEILRADEDDIYEAMSSEYYTQPLETRHSGLRTGGQTCNNASEKFPDRKEKSMRRFLKKKGSEAMGKFRLLGRKSEMK